MHSPLPHGCVIVLKLPLSVSMADGSPAYLLLYKALNGLRDASLHWLNLLSESIREVGLASDEVEPCIYQGRVNGEVALLVAYVDDLLLCCQSEAAERMVEKAIGKACTFEGNWRDPTCKTGRRTTDFYWQACASQFRG